MKKNHLWISDGLHPIVAALLPPCFLSRRETRKTRFFNHSNSIIKLFQNCAAQKKTSKDILGTLYSNVPRCVRILCACDVLPRDWNLNRFLPPEAEGSVVSWGVLQVVVNRHFPLQATRRGASLPCFRFLHFCLLRLPPGP